MLSRRTTPIATAALFVAGLAHAQPIPPFDVPAPLADALKRAKTRVIVIGDSISTNTGGDQQNRNHSPWVVGIHRTWQPAAWSGIYTPVGYGLPSGYNTFRGVGGSFYDRVDAVEETMGLLVERTWPGGLFGFATESAGLVRFENPAIFDAAATRFEFRLFPDDDSRGSRASASILNSSDLIVRHLVFTTEGMITVPQIALEIRRESNALLRVSEPIVVPQGPTRWTTLDFDASGLQPLGFDPASEVLVVRPRVAGVPAAGAQYISDGVVFMSPSAEGMLVASIAEGGWSNDDHLRTSGFGRGYSDLGMREKLRALGFADPGAVPVIVVATGTNVAAGEASNGLTTDVYRANVEAILARTRAQLAAIGAADPYVLLVAMYSWGFPPNSFVFSRAEKLAAIAASDSRVGYVSLPALLGERGADFDSSWYFRQPEAQVTSNPVPGSLNTDDVSDFPSSGMIWVTDGSSGWDASFASRTSTRLDGVVGLPHPLPVGSRVLAVSADLHLSLAGAEAAAAAVWDAIEASVSPCPADWDASGGVDGADITAFFTDWLAGEADADDSGGTDGDDIAFFFARWQSGC